MTKTRSLNDFEERLLEVASHPDSIAMCRTIDAHPDDTMPKLAWYDWLDERVQPDSPCVNAMRLNLDTCGEVRVSSGSFLGLGVVDGRLRYDPRIHRREQGNIGAALGRALDVGLLGAVRLDCDTIRDLRWRREKPRPMESIAVRECRGSNFHWSTIHENFVGPETRNACIELDGIVYVPGSCVFPPWRHLTLRSRSDAGSLGFMPHDFVRGVTGSLDYRTKSVDISFARASRSWRDHRVLTISAPTPPELERFRLKLGAHSDTDAAIELGGVAYAVRDYRFLAWAPSTLQHLSLVLQMTGEPSDLGEIARFTDLRHLELGGNQSFHGLAETVAALPNLRILDLRRLGHPARSCREDIVTIATQPRETPLAELRVPESLTEFARNIRENGMRSFDAVSSLV